MTAGTRDLNWLLEAAERDNLTEDLTEEELSLIGQQVTMMYDLDRRSRSDWDELSQSALKLARQIREQKSSPWPGAANVKHPLITVASIQFAARAYPEICKGNRIVRCLVIGDAPAVPSPLTPPGGLVSPALPSTTRPPAVSIQGTVQPLERSPKRQRADRIAVHMNYQLTQEQPDWEAGMDTLLHVLPVVGQCYKKVYYSPQEGHNVCELVLPDDCVVSPIRSREINKARRITHRLWIYENDALEKMRSGLWREVDLGRPVDAGTDVDAPHEFYEQHCFLDLDGDGYKEPYIVTVHRQSLQVVRVCARWIPENVEPMGLWRSQRNKVGRIVPDCYFIHYGFIPNPDGSVNALGFGQLLEPLNASVNTLLNQLLDAGTLYNVGGGFIGRGVRMRGGAYSFRPGEWKQVDAPGGPLKDSIVPLPHREPSQVAFQLLGFLVQAGKEITSVQDILTGDIRLAANMPVGTAMALVEQGLKVFTAIYKRIFRSLTEEFRRLYELNSRNLSPQVSFAVAGHTEQFVGLSDYQAGDTLVMPVADPDLSSDMQRLLKAQALRDLSNRPGLNEVEVTRQLVRAIRPENMQTLLLSDEQMSGKEPQPWQPPPHPQMVLSQAKAEHLKARAQEAIVKQQLELQRFELESRNLLADIRLKEAEALLALAKAEAAEAGPQLDKYKAELRHLGEQLRTQASLAKNAQQPLAEELPTEGPPAEKPLPEKPLDVLGIPEELGGTLPAPVRAGEDDMIWPSQRPVTPPPPGAGKPLLGVAEAPWDQSFGAGLGSAARPAVYRYRTRHLLPRQEGGPVGPGQAYLVGEAGEEVIVPEEEGTVVSNDQLQYIRDVLERHSDKEFVKRLYDNPQETIPLGDGREGSMLMAWSQGPGPGQFIVYPTIVKDNGELQKLPPDEAYWRAVETNEYITFSSGEAADWFSKYYKAVLAK